MVSKALSPHRTLQAVVIGGSAGAVSALGAILPRLPSDFPSVLVVVHLSPSSPSHLNELFTPRCAMRVREADAFEPIERGTIYFAPADYHLLVEPNRRCALSIEPPVHFSRPAIDVLFESAVDAYGANLAGIVLTGASSDGAEGLRAIHDAGGWSFVQDPSTAESTTMPNAAISAVPAARVISLPAIAIELCSLVHAS